MMISVEKVRSLIEDKIQNTEFYIIDLKISNTNQINVEIESDKPVSITDCVEISKFVENSLDREQEDFAIQVSSYGVDKPLKHYRQYIKNIGREVDVNFADGKKEKGQLIKADQETFTIEYKAKEKKENSNKKIVVVKQQQISYNEVKETKIKISFK
jgi:ribosome maturation factor RimP